MMTVDRSISSTLLANSGGVVMTLNTIKVDRPVRLTDDLPHLGLARGRVGTVCSKWAVAGTTFEVEFGTREQAVRVLLAERQLEAAPEPDTPGVR
jgi:hypothetical protein